MSEMEVEETLAELINYLIINSEPVDSEFVVLVNEHFWELLA